MPGMIVFSSSGSERRAAWWTRLRDARAESRFDLVLPTARQVEMLTARYPLWHDTFERATTLLDIAARAARAIGVLPNQHLVAEGELAGLLGHGEAGVAAARAIIGWQHAGYLVRSELPGMYAAQAPDEANAWEGLEARLRVPVATAAGAALMLARQEPGVLDGAWEDCANLYLEGFMGATPAERALIELLAAARTVIVRVRDIADVPPLESLTQRFVEDLAEGDAWSAEQDEAPADALERQAFAQSLFGSAGADGEGRPARLSGHGAQRVRVASYAGATTEIAGIVHQVETLLQHGALASGIGVALPDAEPYRSLSLRALRADVERFTHADLAVWSGSHLFMAGLDGDFEAPAPGTAGDELVEHLPAHLVDAVEGTYDTVWLSTAANDLAPIVAEAVASLSPLKG